jgi:pimeloyl-ACP methyl ester carboxylesterase
MNRRVSLWATLLAVWVLLAVSVSARQTDDVIELRFETADELVMYGWLTPSPVADNPAPLWVLLHQRAQDHTSWNGLIQSISRRFLDKKAKPIAHPHILVVDLRGHGRSTQLGKFSVSHVNMRNEHFQQMPLDVAQMLRQFMKSDQVDLLIDTANTVFIGSSIGANTAVMATAELEVLPVRAIAMLSPGEEYAGMKPFAAMQQFTGDMLVMTAIEDLLAAASADYFERKLDHLQVIRYPDYAHGIDILDRYPESVRDLLNWLLDPQRYQPRPPESKEDEAPADVPEDPLELEFE